MWRRYVRDPEAVASSLQHVWPLLQAIVENFRGKSSAIERVVRCPRYALKTAGASHPYTLKRVQADLTSYILSGWFKCGE